MTQPAAAAVVAGQTGQATAAVAARAVQLTLRARLMQDVLKLWPMLDRKRLDATFPAWLQGMMTVTRAYHGMSAEAGGRAYQDARTKALNTPTPRSVLRLAPPPSEDWMRPAFGFSGPGTLSRDIASPNAALSNTLGTASRIALDGGRTTMFDTVHADDKATGWYRVTDGDPCAFCALLASRVHRKHGGGVYRSDSFTASNEMFDGPGAAKVHNNCGCTFAPAFGPIDLNPIAQQAADIYENGPPNLTAFRAAWDSRQTG